mmetsp:Transcript_72991/g.206447  ORF Transcript_72991/g.206447 Transcript_72991/m.206447 type:complete len:478 (-) Transcript_72991:188-1621(-)
MRPSSPFRGWGSTSSARSSACRSPGRVAKTEHRPSAAPSSSALSAEPSRTPFRYGAQSASSGRVPARDPSAPAAAARTSGARSTRAAFTGAQRGIRKGASSSVTRLVRPRTSPPAFLRAPGLPWARPRPMTGQISASDAGSRKVVNTASSSTSRARAVVASPGSVRAPRSAGASGLKSTCWTAEAMRSNASFAVLRISDRLSAAASHSGGMIFGSKAARRFGPSAAIDATQDSRTSSALSLVRQPLSARPFTIGVTSIRMPMGLILATTLLIASLEASWTSRAGSEQHCKSRGTDATAWGSKPCSRARARAFRQRRAPCRRPAAALPSSLTASLMNCITPSFFSEPTPAPLATEPTPSATPRLVDSWPLAARLSKRAFAASSAAPPTAPASRCSASARPCCTPGDVDAFASRRIKRSWIAATFASPSGKCKARLPYSAASTRPFTSSSSGDGLAFLCCSAKCASSSPWIACRCPRGA